MKRKFLVLTVFLAFSLRCFSADNWTSISKNETGEFFFNKESIRFEPEGKDTMSAWIKTDFSHQQKIEDTIYNQITQLIVVDCSTQKIATSHIIAKLNGKTVYDNPSDTLSFLHLDPDSIVYATGKFLCKTKVKEDQESQKQMSIYQKEYLDPAIASLMREMLDLQSECMKPKKECSPYLWGMTWGAYHNVATEDQCSTAPENWVRGCIGFVNAIRDRMESSLQKFNEDSLNKSSGQKKQVIKKPDKNPRK